MCSHERLGLTGSAVWRLLSVRGMFESSCGCDVADCLCCALSVAAMKAVDYGCGLMLTNCVRSSGEMRSSHTISLENVGTSPRIAVRGITHHRRVQMSLYHR